MKRAKQEAADSARPDDSPVAWFSELIIAIERGDFSQAAHAQRELDRLGWTVNRRTSRREGKAVAE